MDIGSIGKGQRICVALVTGDSFGLRVESAAHARRTSFAFVTFALDGSEGILFTRPATEKREADVVLARFGWSRPHGVTSIETLSSPADDLEDEEAA
jgi:hypothetical protein